MPSCRDRSKQKYDILEETVLAMSKRLEELEERKAGLLAEVNVFRTQQSYQGNTKRVLLPQIEVVSFTQPKYLFDDCKVLRASILRG